MKKNYQNMALIKRFEKAISGMKIKNVFKPLVVDVLLRRAFEFDLSPEAIDQDLESLLNSLNSIEIKKMPKADKNTFGLYDANKKRIILNADFVRKSLKEGKLGLDEIYVTLTHELYHAMNRDEFGNDRLASKNVFNSQPNDNLLESIIETATNRTIFSRTEKDRYKFKRETKGYSEMTFVIPVLSAVYGVSEKDFLKHAIVSRKSLVDFLSSQAKESTVKTINFLDLIELNLDKIHKALYVKRKKPITKTKRSTLISEAMFSISHICNCKLEQRYAKELVGNADSAYSFVENAKYNHVRIHQILETEIRCLDKEFEMNSIPVITKLKEQSDYNEKRIIMDMDKVVQARHNFESEEEYLRVFDSAKNGILDYLDEAYLREKGIINDRTTNTFEKIDESVIKKFDEDDFQIDASWNNACIQHYILKYISKLLPRRGPIKFVNDGLEEIIYGKQETMSDQISSPRSKSFEHFKLSDEDLEKFNLSAKKVLKHFRKKNLEINPLERCKEE